VFGTQVVILTMVTLFYRFIVSCRGDNLIGMRWFCKPFVYMVISILFIGSYGWVADLDEGKLSKTV